MRLTKRKARVVSEAIRAWQTTGALSSDQARSLTATCEVVSFDWKRLARYSFWFSLACVIIAVGSALVDRELMRLLARFFSAPASVKCAVFAAAAAGFFALGVGRKRRFPGKVFSNEAIVMLGVLATAAAIAFFGEAVDTGSGHFSLLLLLAAIVYAGLGLWFPSTLVWVFALLSLGSWMGAETGYLSGWGAYYLGMTYPARFALFGLALALAGALFDLRGHAFGDSTRVMGYLYLFIALWIMSIFGSYTDYAAWSRVAQHELIQWSILFGVVAAAVLTWGIYRDDPVSRGFGLVFLSINFYTRFFEYFWNTFHKAVFFALLAASFWYLGSRAERIWSLGKTNLPPSPNDAARKVA